MMIILVAAWIFRFWEFTSAIYSSSCLTMGNLHEHHLIYSILNLFLGTTIFKKNFNYTAKKSRNKEACLFFVPSNLFLLKLLDY